jgi:HPt (histidine-containing phosphotransfer) domain-containing protein
MDPISALAIASAAFKGVKALVEAGREIEDVTGQLGTWFSAVADITNAEKDAKRPSFYKKLAKASQSIEQEALDALVAKKKVQEMERELWQMVAYRYGQDAYQEMMQMRKQIMRKREREVWDRKRKVQEVIDGIMITALVLTGVGIIALLIWLIKEYGGK